MGTLAAWKPPPKQQTTSKPPEVPQGNIEDSTHLFLYLIEAQLLENLVKMSTATTSEISGRIPELKTTTSVSSPTSTTPTGPRTSSLLVSQHPLLCSLLSSPSPQQLVVTPRRQQSQEVGVGGGWRNPE